MNTSKTAWHVEFQPTIAYDVINAPNLLDPENGALMSVGRTDHACRFVLVDTNVQKYYSGKFKAYFAAHGINARIVSFPGGEQNKSVESVLSILHELDDFPIHRRDEPIILIGGGVLTDVGGFVASSYRRGVPHINVPTTLMGFIDAAVGIKTGVNFNGHKNRLGAFAPPLKVFLDRAFLQTLPRRHILNGMCEIIKLAIIKDLDLFTWLEDHGSQTIAANLQDEAGEMILERSVSGMLEEIQPNLFEDNLARKVDFGHTFSYGLETRAERDLLHGEAVLLDIAVSVLIARGRQLLSGQEVDRIFRLIPGLGMSLQIGLLEVDRLWESLEERTRHRNGFQRVPLPDGIGKCVFVNDIRRQEIQAAVKNLENWTVLKNAEISQLH